MSAVVPDPAPTPTHTVRTFTIGKVVVWVVAAACLAFVLWQAIGNFVGVTTTLQQNNAFLRDNGGAALQARVPWVALVADVLIAPAGFVAAFLVSRRLDLVRTVVVFVTALCAVSALWFAILQYVASTLRFGS